MTDHILFIPISKVDSQKRLVYGTLSEEVTDKSGEILDYASAKPAFQKWSDAQSAATSGKSKGNLRAMHGNVAAGKFTEISFNDAAKRIEGVAHVVDDAEWAKVEAGVYSGFSIGGGYAKRWTDPDQPHLKRYTPTLAEVSLVDSPCVPTATFEFVKEDGSTELRKFNTPAADPAGTVVKYDEGEARDGHGRWTSGGGEQDKKKREFHEGKAQNHRNQARSSDHTGEQQRAHREAAHEHDSAANNVGTPAYDGAAARAAAASDSAYGHGAKKAAGPGQTDEFNTNQEAPMTKDTTADGHTTEPAVPAAAEAPAISEIAADAALAEPDAAADATDPVEKAADRPQDKGGVVQGFMAKDGSFHLKKADALSRNVEVDAETVAAPALAAVKNLSDALAKAEGDSATPPAAEPAQEEPAAADPAPVADETEPDAEKATPAAGLKKGMSAVGNFATLLQYVQLLQQDAEFEAACEEDDSELPAKLKAWLADGGALLVQMAGEETAELTAAKAADAGELAKKGAALSAATKGHIEAMHTSACGHMDEVAKCYKALGLGADDASKSHTGDLAKGAGDALAAENTALKKVLGDLAPQLDALTKRLESQQAEITKLADQPLPPKGSLRAIDKTTDGGNVSDGDDVKKFQDLTQGKTPEEVSQLLMKAALSNPRPVR